MKKLLTAFAAAAVAMGAYAEDASNFTIYINPGHGGHDADDRNVVIEPYQAGDPNGYWESNSNLEKGLALRDMLEAKGYHVVMSRTTNTTEDDLGLSTIGRLANQAGSRLFFSIHSNATGTAARRNFPLMLFRGYDNDPVRPESKQLAEALNPHLLQNQVTYWTSTTPNVRGDFSFYPSWGTQGLGVLRQLTVTGMLSEGSFHDYIPEAYRLMSKEYCWLEAYHFRRCIDEFLNVPGETVGHIFGRLNDTRAPRPGDYLKYGDDLLATVNNATVELLDANGTLLQTYTTDPVNVNGVYAFKNLEPGTYKVRAYSDTYYPQETTVEVQADLVTYANMRLNKIRLTAPEVVSYSPVWSEGDEALLCNTPVTVEFNWDMDTEATAAAFSIEPAVEGTVTWEDLNYRLVFTPAKAYETNTEYTVTIGTGATHAGGMTMEQPVQFKFRTTDRNFMEILGYYPKEGDEVHYHGATIEFRFDKRPNVSPILSQVTCEDADGNPVKFNNRGILSSKAKDPYGFFRIPFQGDLVPGKLYTLHISDRVSDRDGITIQNGMDITFRAVDAGADKPDAATENFEDASIYVFDEDQSIAVASQAVTVNSAKALFGNALSLAYSFAEEQGEVSWHRTATDVSIVPGSIVGIHVNGDLSGNELYLQCSSELGDKFIEVCRLDFLGWKYIEVPATALEGTDPYLLSGIKIVRVPGMASGSGTVMLDRLSGRDNGSGVNDVEVSTITVHPNPASQYLVANGDIHILSVELVNMEGATVARAAGNIINVEAVPEGHYFLLVTTANGRTAHRVIVNH